MLNRGACRKLGRDALRGVQVTEATDIFLSYKTEDRARLKPLVIALEAEGLTVWWDARIGGGSHWRDDIQQHLDAAKCVIVAWTKRSVGPGANFFRDEAARAQRRHAYLPVCLDPVDPPLGFGEIQALTLQGWRGNRSDPRFQALIHAVLEQVSGEKTSPFPPHFASPPISRRTAVAGGIGIGALGFAGTGAWFLLKSAPADARRIAVLPFANLSGDPAQSYFSEGIAEELRSALSRVGLEVIGRSSSDAVKDLDTEAAAARLGVAHVLTGSVRRSPEVIRVNAQLIGGSDGVQRWAQTYDRAPGDAIKIQTDIAGNVVQAMSVALGKAGQAGLTLGGTTDSLAQDYFLQARKLRREADNPEAFRKSLSLLDIALKRDPKYADAYVLRADELTALASNYPTSPAESIDQLAQAEMAARRAMELAPKFGGAYAMLAYIDRSRTDFPNASKHIRQALELSPDDPNVLTPAGIIVPYLGDGHEALRLADRLIALDPLDGLSFRRKSEALESVRRYRESIDAGRRALALAPNVSLAHWWIGRSLTLLGQHAQASAEFERMPADDGFRLTGEAIVAARTGDSVKVQRTLMRMRSLFGPAASYQYGEIYVQMEDRDRAFEEFDNAIETKDSGLIYLKKDAFLDPIREDPRYRALLGSLNFP